MKHSPFARGFLSLRQRKMHHRHAGRFHELFRHHSMEEDRHFSSEKDHGEHHHGMMHKLEHHGMKHKMGHHHGMKHKMGHHHGMMHKMEHHHGMKHKMGHHRGMMHTMGHHHDLKHRLEDHPFGMKHGFGHHHGMKHAMKHKHGKKHMRGHDHGFEFRQGFSDHHHGHGKSMMKRCHGMKQGLMHKGRHGPGMQHKKRFYDSDYEESSAYNSCCETEEEPTSESKTKAQITRENDKFQISLDTSCYQPEKVTVEVMDGKINVSAIHESMEDDLYEFHEMYRSFSLPADVNPINITSRLNDDGKLTIEAPIVAPKENVSNEKEIPVTLASE